MLTRRQFALAAALQGRRRPNVLFVLCGHWRRQAMPDADKALKAPHLARLGRDGVEFTRAYVANPASGPSRAALQTGRFPHSVSVPWSGRQLPQEYPCLAEAFAEAGYKTGYIGNWELDGAETPGFVPPGARRRGFQYWAAFNQGRGYRHSTYFLNDPAPVEKDGFEPDLQTDLALQFLARNQAEPYFLLLSYGPPRGPFVPADGHAASYQPEALALRENVPAKSEAAARKDLAAYYSLCSAIDDNVGRLLRALEQGGQAENTIVVFTSDRGELLHSHGLAADQQLWHEESCGVPLLMRWPGKLTAGAKQDWLFNNVDVAPVLRGLCGLPGLEGAHGEDRAALLLGQGVGTRPESIYVQGELGTPREWRMVIRGWDKVVVDRELKVTHLFNLAQDPLEKDNLVIDRASVRRQEELLALMRRWINKTGDRVPYPGRAPA